MLGHSNAVASWEQPESAVCEFLNGHCRPDKINTTNKNRMKDQKLKKDHNITGNMVSAYHYILRAPCRLYCTKSKLDPFEIFSGGCDFRNHASGYMSIKNPVTINATEYFKAKLTF